LPDEGNWGDSTLNIPLSLGRLVKMV
jgi:hypothetical protein